MLCWAIFRERKYNFPYWCTGRLFKAATRHKQRWCGETVFYTIWYWSKRERQILVRLYISIYVWSSFTRACTLPRWDMFHNIDNCHCCIETYCIYICMFLCIILIAIQLFCTCCNITILANSFIFTNDFQWAFLFRM